MYGRYFIFDSRTDEWSEIPKSAADHAYGFAGNFQTVLKYHYSDILHDIFLSLNKAHQSYWRQLLKYQSTILGISLHFRIDYERWRV